MSTVGTTKQPFYYYRAGPKRPAHTNIRNYIVRRQSKAPSFCSCVVSPLVLMRCVFCQVLIATRRLSSHRTVIRSTQFIEFLGGIADAGQKDGVINIRERPVSVDCRS